MPSVHLQTASQSFPRWLPDGSHLGTTCPAQIRPCHLLLESPRLTRAGCPRRGGFTCHRARAQLVLWARGNHLTSVWSAGGELAPTHDGAGFQPSPVLCPGAHRCRPTRLGYACGVPTGPAAHEGPSPSFPCTDRDGPQNRKEGSKAHCPMLLETTAGRRWRHSAQGRGQENPTRGACSPCEGDQAVGLTLLATLMAHWGRPSQLPIAPLCEHKEESLLLAGSLTGLWSLRF